MDSSKSPQSDEQWRQQLSEEQYRILREKGTEAPFSGEYNDCKKQGMYRCAGCGAELFRSSEKFDSGSGWPSFTDPSQEGSVAEQEDLSHGMVRTEVTCSNCGGHLGHVFPDGPGASGQRYCINSGALSLEESEESPTDSA